MKLIILMFFLTFTFSFFNRGKKDTQGKYNIVKAIRGKLSLYKNAPSYGAQIQNEATIERKYNDIRIQQGLPPRNIQNTN